MAHSRPPILSTFACSLLNFLFESKILIIVLIDSTVDSHGWNSSPIITIQFNFSMSSFYIPFVHYNFVVDLLFLQNMSTIHCQYCFCFSNEQSHFGELFKKTVCKLCSKILFSIIHNNSFSNNNMNGKTWNYIFFSVKIIFFHIQFRKFFST